MNTTGIPEKPGVYSLRHKSGAEYIGSSNNLKRRVGYARWTLRNNKHNSPDMQSLWSSTDESEWEVIVVELCSESDIVAREQFHMDRSPNLLNLMKVAGKTGVRRAWSEESKAKARLSRTKYLEDPEARKQLSERAKKQHEAGKLGAATFTEDSIERRREARSQQYKDPVARAKHSERVRQQIAEGNFGPATWKGG